jgi:hypothetical protein
VGCGGGGGRPWVGGAVAVGAAAVGGGGAAGGWVNAGKTAVIKPIDITILNHRNMQNSLPIRVGGNIPSRAAVR